MPVNDRNLKMLNVANIYGSGAAMKQMIELKAASKVGRLPGLKSSRLGLEILDNRLGKFDYEDYMRMDDPFRKEVDIHSLIYSDKI